MTKFYAVLAVIAVIGIGAVGYSVGSNAFGTAVSEPIDMPELEDQDKLVELAQGVTLGDSDAPYTVIEFGDYQCPGCGGFALSVKPQVELSLVETGRASFVFYDLPLTVIHPHAFLAARAARCSGDQDKFWEYHQTLFRNQPTWSGMENPIGTFVDYAEEVGADTDAFEGCLRSDRYADVVTANMRLAELLQINSTPTVMVQGTVGGRVQLRPVPSGSFQGIQQAIEAFEAAGSANE